MRILKPVSSPYIDDVDPKDIVISHIEHSFVTGGLVAYGYRRSEMKPQTNDLTVGSGPIRRMSIMPFLEPGEVYRVAYQDDHGAWCAEGTLHWERPPDLIMAQIFQKLA